MEFELKASTEAGKRMVELAERHASDFALTAAENDLKGMFPVENIRALQKSGFAAAAVPEEFGGMGVTSIHDCVVAMNRLGRAEGSTPLAFTMHLSRTMSIVRARRNAIATGNKKAQSLSEYLLKKIGAGDLMITVANSERGANIRTSRTLATKVDGDGFSTEQRPLRQDPLQQTCWQYVLDTRTKPASSDWEPLWCQ